MLVDGEVAPLVDGKADVVETHPDRVAEAPRRDEDALRAHLAAAFQAETYGVGLRLVEDDVVSQPDVDAQQLHLEP